MSESRELELVEKVELRLTLADTPDKYQQTLDIFLTPLLLKLASTHASVRKTVLNSLNPIISRLNSFKDVRIPVMKLLEVAKNPTLEPDALQLYGNNVRLYSLLFAAKGIDRLDMAEKNHLISFTMSGIESLPDSIRARMFHILCKLIMNWEALPSGNSVQEKKIEETLHSINTKDRAFLLDKFTKFFLLGPSRHAETGIAKGYNFPGLTAKEVDFFNYNAGVSFSKDLLMKYKRAIYIFFSKGLPTDETDLVRFFTVVSADNSNLSDLAMQNLKHLNTPIEDLNFVNWLIDLYTGDLKQGRPPVRVELQLKIMKIINSSVVSTTDASRISQICSLGLSSAHQRLKSLTLIFIRHVAELNPQNLHFNNELEYGDDILSRIRNNLNSQGWPKIQLVGQQNSSNAMIILRQEFYETIGIVLRHDRAFLENFVNVEFLFDSLRGDIIDCLSSIQSALLSLIDHTVDLPLSWKAKLSELIKKYLSYKLSDDSLTEDDSMKTIMACKYICLRFNNCCFPFDNIEARLMCLYGTAKSNRRDIIEEASKGLDPYLFALSSSLKDASPVSDTLFPRFDDLMSTLLNEYTDSSHTDQINECLGNFVKFSKHALISNCLHDIGVSMIYDEGWLTRIETAPHIIPNVRRSITTYLSDISSNSLIKFIGILIDEACRHMEDNIPASLNIARETVYQEVTMFLLSNSDDQISSLLEPKVNQLREYLNNYDKVDTNSLLSISSILGMIVASNPEAASSKKLLQEDSNDMLGTLYSKCNIFGSLHIRGKTTLIGPEVLEQLVKTLIDNIRGKIRKSESTQLLSILLKYGVLDILNEKETNVLISSIQGILKNSLVNNIDNCELYTYSTFYFTKIEQLKESFNPLLDLHNSKQEDFLISVGELISVYAGGWSSSYLENQLDCSYNNASDVLAKHRDRSTSYTLERILEFSYSTKPSLKKAGCIWLLCLVQSLSSLPALRDSCKKIHLAFMKHLTDREEFVQESASRGLSLIYELGDSEMKEEMIKSLMKSFVSAAGDALNSESANEETILFEPGTLNTDNGSISTYRDILSLASEVGNPALVYQFMNLAKSSALWSSKKGIAFGLSAIMSKTSLEEMLLKDEKVAKKLIPKLYRYRFDPYSSVSNSMNAIWKALINDSTKVQDIYIDDIIEELLQGMGYKEWRVREASTTALIQLIQSQKQQKFTKKLPQIWTMAFRTMDDIKESVRVVGLRLTNILSKQLANTINANKDINTEKSHFLLNQILPFLLGPKGIDSDAEDVRKFSLQTLLMITKDSDKAIRPFALDLTYRLITILSSIEPQAMNFLALNAENFNMDSSTIDTYRKAAIAGSPILQTVERLVNNSSNDMIEELVNISIKTVKKSVGLPSRVAASMLYTFLVKRYSIDLRPYCGKLLKSCVNQFEDRNISVAIAFAQAFGYLYMITPMEKLIKYAKVLSSMYFNNGKTLKIVIGSAIESIIDHSHSQYDNVSSILSPFVFFASHDKDESIAKIFSKILTEVSKSTSGTVKLYLSEISSIIEEHCQSSDFDMRFACAKSLSTVCESIDPLLKNDSVKNLIDISLKLLNGRIWEGKEMIMPSVIKLIKKFETLYKNDIPLQEKVVYAFDREIKRSNIEYVKQITLYYGDLLELECNSEMFRIFEVTCQNLLNQLLEYPGSENEKEMIDPKRIKTIKSISHKSTKENIANEEYIIELLNKCASITSSRVALEKYNEFQEMICKYLLTLFNSPKLTPTWRSQLAIAEIGQLILVNSQKIATNNQLEECIMQLWECTIQNMQDFGTIENVQLAAVKFGEKISTTLPRHSKQVLSELKGWSDQNLTPRVVTELKKLQIVKLNDV